MSQYDVGDTAILSAMVKDADDVLTDPTSLVLTIKDPSGTKTVYTYGTDAELVKDSVGMYHFDLTFDKSGIWRYRFVATGGVDQAEQGSIPVCPSAI